MNRGSEALQLFKSLLGPTLLILLWMSFIRLSLYGALFFSQLGWHQDLPAAFIAGFRFDLLVMGFFWIPVVLGGWASVLFVSPRKLFLFWKLYFVVVVLLIFDFSWLDFFWTAFKGERLNHEFLNENSMEFLDQSWQQLGPFLSWSVTAFFGIYAMALVFYLYRLRMKKDYSLPSRKKIMAQALFSIFLVALAARGTWTPHHLNLEHSQISQTPQINQIPLNALWNLDK